MDLLIFATVSGERGFPRFAAAIFSRCSAVIFWPRGGIAAV